MVRYLQSLKQLENAQLSKIVAIGTKGAFLEQLESPSFLLQVLNYAPRDASSPSPAKLAKSDDTANLSLFRSVVASLSPSSDSGSASEFWYTTPAGHTLQVAFCALPTAVSRHNTPSRPHACTNFVKKYKGKGQTLVAYLLDDPSYALATGVAVARAAPLYTRKNGQTAEKDQLSVLFSQVNEQELQLIQNTANGVQLACRLVDAPTNELHTDAFVEEAQQVAKDLDAQITVIRGEELREKGMGGIYGVGKASDHPPALVILSHYPPNTTPATPAVTFVGKGIVFDTGGLSIKTKDGMPGMKRDMGGAAAILGGFDAAVRSNSVTRPLHAVLCLAENSVGPIATRPDDVHRLYSGLTVEINNTDAEGRLVLGDGVAYSVAHLNPDVIVDMATLTGAQGVATGKYFSSVYSNDEDLEQAAVRAGKYTGDLAHPVPYAPEFFRQEFKSAIADMKNSVKDRANAQVSCAGQFIGNHLGGFQHSGKWLHVDFAYPSFTKADERATGYGVAFIQGLLRELEK